jgi:hypothetical protein
MPDTTTKPDGGDEFYVGYLRTAPRHRRLLRALVPVLLITAVGAAVLIASSQQDPGDGVWDLDREHVLEGTLVVEPYPFVLVDGRRVLLTGATKQGVAERVRGWDGRRVRVHGHTVTRGDLRMLSLAERDDPVTVIAPRAPLTTATSSASAAGARVVLRGEIIDPKCYAGAMKPGGGKAHKGCAVLCLRGGIPPVLVSVAPGGAMVYDVLVDAEGRALTGEALEAILPYVADVVKVTGVRETRHGLRLLRIAPGAVRRL